MIGKELTAIESERKYKIYEAIDEGVSFACYKAINEHKEHVAIKIAKRLNDAQFTTELANLINLKDHTHPNVIKKLDENTKEPE